jgi:ribose transport system ATP-binding protein
MMLRGNSFAPISRRAAEQSGVVMVLQELSVIPILTVAENIFLDRLPTSSGFSSAKGGCWSRPEAHLRG